MSDTIRDMSNTYIEHSMVIMNFTSIVKRQLHDSLCGVFSDNVQYQWSENSRSKYVIPDASINCNMRDRKNVAFTGVPKFVMEVISAGSVDDDTGWKKNLYELVGVSEYWLVDWRKKEVQIFINDDDGSGGTKFYLQETVNEKNKEKLQLQLFPNIHITWEELFEGI